MGSSWEQYLQGIEVSRERKLRVGAMLSWRPKLLLWPGLECLFKTGAVRTCVKRVLTVGCSWEGGVTLDKAAVFIEGGVSGYSCEPLGVFTACFWGASALAL